MGNEIFIYFPIEETQFTARISANGNPKPGLKRNLYFDTSKLHFFDFDSEERIK